MHRAWRLALGLSCPLLIIVHQAGWLGPWVIVPIVACGVGSVLWLLLDARRDVRQS